MNARRARCVALVLVAAGAASHVAAEPAAPPRYGAAMADELAAMGLDPTCEALSPTRMRCNYRARSSATERAFEAHAIYSDDTDTIYFCVEHYLDAPPAAASTTVLLRRLMELNWSTLVGKFEWNPRDGEVRLSAVLNTDSNFDRRAFRSTVLAVDTIGARYHAELSALAGAAPAAAED